MGDQKDHKCTSKKQKTTQQFRALNTFFHLSYIPIVYSGIKIKGLLKKLLIFQNWRQVSRSSNYKATGGETLQFTITHLLSSFSVQNGYPSERFVLFCYSLFIDNKPLSLSHRCIPFFHIVAP